MLQYIKEAVQKKVSGWQTRFLSTAGKETLIKAVAYAMPVYSMNVFQLPMELCSEIDSMIARFWWGSTNEKKKLSWVSWKKMARTKKEGGMGFRYLHLFNQALLANQAWKILQRPESLLFRMLKARYFREGNLLTANRGSQPSYGWNSLRYGCLLLKDGLQISIGDGRSTELGNDPWLPTNPPRQPRLLDGVDPRLKVQTLIDQSTLEWDEQKIHQLVLPEDHALISKIYLPSKPCRDSYLWSHTKNGCYTVKSGYWTAVTRETDIEDPNPPLAAHPDIARSLWSLDIAPKLRHFLWRVSSRAIGTADNLRRRNIHINPFCAHCCTELETSDHVLFSCPQAALVWRMTGLPTSTLCDPRQVIEEKLRMLFKLHKDPGLERSLALLPFWVMWRMWKSRNSLVFNSKQIEPFETINRARADTKEWMESRDETEQGLGTCAAPRHRSTQWTKPGRGWVKCNYDASHHEGPSVSGMGWIIRDSYGTVLECGMGKFQGRSTPEEAECSALIWAIQAAFSLGYRNVVFEGDNLNINTIVNKNSINIRLRHYTETIQHWRRHFTAINFNFKHRESNMCADILAKKAIVCNTPWSIFRSCPLFLYSAVNNDNESAN